MDTLYSILIAIDVLLAISIIGLVLIQHGKGADVGAAFGSGASGTVFGAQGSASFLTKVTTILAVLFFINSLWLAHLASNRPVAESVIDSVMDNTTADEASSTIPEADAIESDIPANITDDVPSLDEPKQNPSNVSVQNNSQTNAVSEDAVNTLQDSAESIKEGVGNTLENVTPDDVPE
jgi:preprotein translocase subunit SecG